jgi:hypothetical protein
MEEVNCYDPVNLFPPAMVGPYCRVPAYVTFLDEFDSTGPRITELSGRS